jgi:C-terminal processing protease CtpA/Prc
MRGTVILLRRAASALRFRSINDCVAAVLLAIMLSIGSAWLTVQAAAKPAVASNNGEHLGSIDRGVMEQMLKDMLDAVRKEYFDPKFGGVDLNAAYAEAQASLVKANSVHEGYETVANMMRRLNDSHTHFIPPEQPFTIDAGWTMQLIGDKCFVSRVKSGSDAESKGLKPGDEISVIDTIKPSRANWADLNYSLNLLSPRSSLHVVVTSPGGEPRVLVTQSVVKSRPAHYDLTNNEYWIFRHQMDTDLEKYDSRELTLGDVQVWQLRNFYLQDAAIDSMFHKAENSKAIIFDLRQNPGGHIDTMNRILGKLFDHDVQVAQTIGREKSKPVTAKHSSRPFAGKIIVLVDSKSASCSELFARVMQLERRGTVIGDLTAGEVREAKIKPFVHGQETVFVYAAEVTVADLKMADGQTLEKTGVTPDEVLLPSQKDLAAGADPQLARALELAGVTMSPEKAGKLFPPLQ